MKNVIWAVTLLIVGILLVGMFLKKGDEGSVRLGAAVGLTGYCASWGESERNVMQLAIDEANAKGGIQGKRIELIIEDIACEQKAAVSAVTKLIDVDQVAGIVGPTWGDAFPAAFSITNARGVVAVSPSMAMESLAHDGIEIDYVFATWFPQQGEIDTLQKHMALVGAERIVVLHDEDLFASAMADIFNKRTSVNGLSILEEYTFPIDFDDFRTTIVKLKGQNPDGIFAVFKDPATKARFFKQAKELGLNVRFFSLTDVEDETLVNDFSVALDGVVYTHARATDEGRAFEERYSARYGDAPIGISGMNTYDATNILIEALRKTDGKREGLREALLEVSVPGAVTEEVRFDEKHQIVGIEFVVKTIRDGKFVELR